MRPASDQAGFYRRLIESTPWMERPVDFVAACSAMTVDGLGLCAALRLGDDDTEVIAALGTGTGKVYGHLFNLALPVRPFNSAQVRLYGITPSRFRIRSDRPVAFAICAGDFSSSRNLRARARSRFLLRCLWSLNHPLSKRSLLLNSFRCSLLQNCLRSSSATKKFLHCGQILSLSKTPF